ncbi:MAG: hypothetical protein B6A08_13000 [Sorangiineae bacterium NIC37A_2]|nr:MAG: hypothetical protein B6A08_13000 [Sorangiineae bacterium NIC37A_2]
MPTFPLFLLAPARDPQLPSTEPSSSLDSSSFLKRRARSTKKLETFLHIPTSFRARASVPLAPKNPTPPLRKFFRARASVPLAPKSPTLLVNALLPENATGAEVRIPSDLRPSRLLRLSHSHSTE